MPRSDAEDMRRHPPLAAWLALGLVVVILIALFSADPFLNNIVQKQLGKGDSTNSGPVEFMGRLHLSPWTLRLQCDSLALRGANQRFHLTTGVIVLSGIRWYLLAFGGGIAAEGISIHTPRFTLSSTTPDSVKPSAASTRPELPSFIRPIRVHRLSVLNGSSRFGTKSSLDSLSIVLYDVNLERPPESLKEWLQTFGNAAVEIGGGSTHDPRSGYRFVFSRLSCNTDEGFLRLDSLTVKPASPDSAFFAAAGSRTSRFIVSMGRISLAGFRFSDVQNTGALYARSLLLDRVSWSTLIDKRKPDNPLARPQMPNEILSRMETDIHLDTLRILHGLITYGELFPYSPTPALLHWSKVQGTITDIDNRPGRSGDSTGARIDVSGSLMDQGKIHLTMQMPLSREAFSLSCSGSVGAMDLDTLNSWLAISDGTRVTEGRMEKADFSFHVLSGRASGTAVPLYSGLTIATLNKKTGSSKGAVQAVKSFLANVIKITDANPPEPGAPPVQGKISYVRQPTDPFFGYLWLSLRTGLGSVVGFSQ